MARSDESRSTLLAPVSDAAGATLAAAIRSFGAVLDRRKPLHPHGAVCSAVIERDGAPTDIGVPLIDERGDLQAIVRLSRGVGLPEPLPDVAGLAVRVDPEGVPADVLLASTGTGRLGRFVLAPRLRRPGAMTTLLPYRSDRGPLLIAAFPDGERAFTLCWAVAVGDWQPFARLRLGDEQPDEDISFEPTVNLPAGLQQYAVVRRLRRPAYLRARRARGE